MSALGSLSRPIEVAGLEVASPVFLASGCGGTGRELASYVDLGGAGWVRHPHADPQPARRRADAPHPGDPRPDC